MEAAIEPQINAAERRWEGNCRTGSPSCDWCIADRPGTDSRAEFYLRSSASICGFQVQVRAGTRYAVLFVAVGGLLLEGVELSMNLVGGGLRRLTHPVERIRASLGRLLLS